MPYKSQTTCRQPGCSRLVPRGYCVNHAKPKIRRIDNRPGPQLRGYDVKWKAFSKSYLARHPYCYYCARAEVLTPATITDHVIPISIIKDLFGDDIYKDEYYRPSCASCNTRKGANEDKVMLAAYREGGIKSLVNLPQHRSVPSSSCVGKNSIRGSHE